MNELAEIRKKLEEVDLIVVALCNRNKEQQDQIDDLKKSQKILVDTEEDADV